MKKDKEEGRREHAAATEPDAPTTLERLATLTRKVLAVPKSEIDERERAEKAARRPAP
jgi:hypothetical protein